eukprot:5376759-Pyramimonas_sp.AAC.1
MKAGRTGADDGLVMEMLRAGHVELMNVLASYITCVLVGAMGPPSEWRVARLSVIFKKGSRSELT